MASGASWRLPPSLVTSLERLDPMVTDFPEGFLVGLLLTDSMTSWSENEKGGAVFS